VPVPVHTLGLIADDLTGASDTAVQFAQRGWIAVVDLRGLTPATTQGSDPYVLAVTTDARALDNASAERLTGEAVTRLLAAGVDRIYLKIDSTMRGSIAAQISGALAAWRTVHPTAGAVVCPAYPRMGRTVVANRLLVGGEQVDTTPIGRDPITPVTTSDLGALIPGSSHVRADQVGQRVSPVMTVDARSDEELATLASTIAACGPSVIAVGSAGLAGALAQIWSPGVASPGDVRSVRLQPDGDPRILIQVTSLNPVSAAQIARLERAFPDVRVLQGRAEEVAERVADLVAREHWDVLGLIGGDGARAALRRLDASSIRIVDSTVEGIPSGIVTGGRADGMRIFTKAGGFGSEDALVQVVERIRG